MKKLIVVIDAGHGGHDPGAVNGILKEKDRALTYALKLGKSLEKQGITVIYTRTTDEFIKLQDRSRISNNANATLFISIHLNSFTDPKANGVETLYYPTSSKGKELASNVQSEIVKAGLCNSDRGIKPRGNLSVLGPRTKAPAALIELGFISNVSDVQLLANKEDEIVQAMTRGVLKSLDVKYNDVNLKPSKGKIKGGNIVRVNFKGKNIEVDGKLIDGTNYVSIRELFEKLGHEVSWDSENQIVVID